MLRIPRFQHWRTGVALAAAGTLLLGGAALARSHLLPMPLAAQAAPSPTAAPAASPAPAHGQRLATVTAISQNPPSFTVRQADGQLVTYLVRPTTVFRAGKDRPASFDQLKVGDRVAVRGKPVQGTNARAADGQWVARLVTVRPAGEQPAGSGPGARAAKAHQKGGSRGTVQ